MEVAKPRPHRSFGAVQMVLIYVNPEGPNSNPDLLAAAREDSRHVRSHGDERRGDGCAHSRRHTFGKCHGAVDPQYVGPEPEASPVEHQGLGSTNSYGSGKGVDTLTSGLEGAWTNEPAKWDDGFFDNLFNYEYELTTSPAGAKQWTPSDPSVRDAVPDAHDPSKRHAPMMLTTDLALKMDPVYGPISKRFHENPDQFADAFAKAWFKLLHRDMGLLARYLGPSVPEPQLWQDPVPEVNHELIGGTTSMTSRARFSTPGSPLPRSSPPLGRRRPPSTSPTGGRG